MENKVSGAPVNTKSLMAFLFLQMEKLDKGEITEGQAVAQSKLAAQACNLLNYELKRTILQVKLTELGYNGKNTPCLREIESKGFDDTITNNKK